MRKHVHRTFDVLRRFMSMMLVATMLFLAAAVHIPAETFMAATETGAVVAGKFTNLSNPSIKTEWDNAMTSIGRM